MWFNSTQREEPYQPLTCPVWAGEIPPFGSAGGDTGAAWLSSARVVRCWVKSRNERNPHLQLPAVRPGTLQKLPVTSRRKAGMTSSPHGLYGLGYTRATMVGTEGCEGVSWSQSQKTDRSSDCSLQLASMKSESLVIADQHAAVNTFPGLVHTARHTMGVGFTLRRCANPELRFGGVADHGKVSDWGEVVTR